MRTKKANRPAPSSSGCLYPEVFVLSSKFDLSVDYVVARLQELGTPYFRLNSEDLPSWELEFDPLGMTLHGRNAKIKFTIAREKLRSIYFRRPVFLREYGVPFTIDEQHQRIQWSSFYRSLMVFDQCQWVNNPAATYLAEHKAIQLKAARQTGLDVPSTLIVNCLCEGVLHFNNEDLVAVKGLDTVLVRSGSEELFGYTNIMRMSELRSESLKQAPFILQQALCSKTDIRVTIVDTDLFAVSILGDNRPVMGDWRKAKMNLSYHPITLPDGIQRKCRHLTKKLGLTFGAIDLALHENKYYFLEVNPTGEWAWLVDRAGLPIDMSLARILARGVVEQC